MDESLNLPPPSHPCWAKIATGAHSRPWHSLGAQLEVARIKASMKGDPSPANIAQCAEELHAWFHANGAKARQDLAAISAGNFDTPTLR